MRRPLEPEDYPFFDYRRLTFSLGVAAEGQIWLSGSTAVRYDQQTRAMVVEGDLLAQARLIFSKMQKTLAADGLPLQSITRMVQYVTPTALPQLPHLEALRASVFGKAAPIVSTIVVDRLLREAALIEIEGIANAGERPPVLLVSAEGDPTVGGIVAQCRAAYSQLERLLKASGASLANVVKTTEFITPEALADYRHTAEVRRDVFSAPYPAATGVICSRLARPGSQILVEATALGAA